MSKAERSKQATYKCPCCRNRDAMRRRQAISTLLGTNFIFAQVAEVNCGYLSRVKRSGASRNLAMGERNLLTILSNVVC